MRPVILKKQLVLILICGWLTNVKAQDTFIKFSSLKDKLITRYLSDTLKAAVKIQELTDSARKAIDRNDKISAIEDYEIALTLVPYAKDSFNILTPLYAHFGGLLYNSGAEDMGNIYAGKALMENRKANKKASVWRYNLLSSIVGKYIHLKEYDSAEVYYKEAKKEAWATGEHLSMAAAENNIGMLYELRNMHDSAYNYFIRSIKILSASNRRDSILLGSINDNIALNYFKRNKFDTAEKYYSQNITLFTHTEIPVGIFKSEIGAANCMIARHNYPGGLCCINQALNCMIQYSGHFNAHDRIALLQSRQHYYSAVGNLRQALVQQTEIDLIKDSLAMEQKRISDKLLQGLTSAEIIKANRGIEIYNLKLQQNKASLEESHKSASMRLLLAIIIALSGGSIIILLIIFLRSRQRIHQGEIKLSEQKEALAKSELERQKLEQEKIERELSNKKDDLRNLGKYLTELKDVQETVAGKLGEIKNQKADQQKSSISSLLNELNSKIHSQERLEVINKSIEQVNAEFNKKLIGLYPNLTKSELELCGYLKLNMSNKEIGILKNITPDSIKKGRHRLRKKLGLNPEADIYKLLTEI